jgi:peptidoglycan/LPS O-acetylase OafA/YrhL
VPFQPHPYFQKPNITSASYYAGPFGSRHFLHFLSIYFFSPEFSPFQAPKMSSAALLGRVDDDIEPQQGLLWSEKDASPDIWRRITTTVDLRRLPQLLASKIGRIFIPSFFWTLTSSNHVKVQKRLQYTAALDGLRGFAAFIVVTYHWFLFFYDMNGGYIPGSAHAVFTNLPFVKFFTNGVASVAIFFVISGYALSYKPLKLSRTQSWESLHQTLCSSVFRRALRLYLPCLFNLFCLSILFWMGINEPGRKNITQAWLGSNWYPPRFESLSGTFRLYFDVAMNLANPWSWDVYRPIEIDSNMWTIPIEFRASMVLFLFLLGLGKVTRFIRLTLFAIGIVSATYGQRSDMVLFLAGSILADLDLEADSRHYDRAAPTGFSIRHNVGWSAVILFGVYMASSPLAGADQSIGYGFISWLSNKVYWFQAAWFPWTIGGILLVYAATKPNFLHRFLMTDIIQYLGHISYAMYIVHGALLRVLAYNLVPLLWKITGHSGAGYFVGSVVGYFLSIAVLIPVADAFWRGIDAPSIRFAKWVESKCFLNQ